MKNLINKSILATLLVATIFSCTKEKIALSKNLNNQENNIENSSTNNDSPYITCKMLDTPYVGGKILDTPYISNKILDTPYVGGKLVDTPYIKK